MRWIIDTYEDGEDARFKDRLKVTREAVRLWKSKGGKPSLDTLADILRHYPKVNPEWLVLGRGPRERPKGSGKEDVARDVISELRAVHNGLAERYGEPRLTSRASDDELADAIRGPKVDPKTGTDDDPQ